MANSIRPPGPRHIGRILRGAGFAALGFALLAGTSWLGVPPLVKHLAQQQIAQQLGRKATLANVSFNPLTLTLTASGFELYEANGTTVAFSANTLLVNASIASLVKLAPVLQQVTLSGPKLHVMRSSAADGGRSNFSDIIERILAQPRSEGEARFSVSNLELIDGSILFDDRVTGNVRTYAPYARIIHADIDPAEIGKNVAVEVPIVGDAKRVLQALTGLVDPVEPATRADYSAQLADWKADSVASSWHGSGAWRDGVLSADYVIERICELTDHEGTYVADVGQNQMWLARYAGFRHPNTHVSSGGLGTMGFSVPAAMGAALGQPDRETWAITGDGGFQMTFQELMTLVADHIPVKIALLDNKKLGMIRQWQEIIYAGNYHSSNLPGPDFAKLADAFGIPAFRARTPGEVDAAIRGAQAVDGPALCWFEIAEEQNVFPMMPAGKGLSDLIENWGGPEE